MRNGPIGIVNILINDIILKQWRKLLEIKKKMGKGKREHPNPRKRHLTIELGGGGIGETGDGV